jgi:hypothetical protein
MFRLTTQGFSKNCNPELVQGLGSHSVGYGEVENGDDEEGFL